MRLSFLVQVGLFVVGASGLAKAAEPSPKPEIGKIGVRSPDARPVTGKEMKYVLSRIDELTRLKKEIHSYENWSENPALTERYGEKDCNCGPSNQCSITSLVQIGAITPDEVTTKSLMNDEGRTHEWNDVNYEKVSRGTVCTKVYRYVEKNASQKQNTISDSCLAAVNKCGLVRLDKDKKKLEKQLADAEKLKGLLEHLAQLSGTKNGVGEQSGADDQSVASQTVPAEDAPIKALQDEIRVLEKSLKEGTAY